MIIANRQRGIIRALWLILCAELIISRLLVVSNILIENNETFSALILTVNLILISLYLLGTIQDRKVLLILIVSYFIRLAYNVYSCANIPLSSDMEAYQSSAEAFFYYNSTSMRTSSFSMAIVLMGLFYKIFGIQRILFQQFNAALIVAVGVIVYRSCIKLNVSRGRTAFAVGWTQFQYNLFMNSCTVHREAMIAFCVAAAMGFFVDWYLGGGAKNAICVFLFSLLASAMHAGTIGLLAAYAISFILYKPPKGRFEFTAGSIAATVAIAAVVVFLYFGAFDIFLRKFSGRTFQSMISMTGSERGGSYYRIGGNITNQWQMLLYTPLRALYLFCSPMPWDWRGIRDILGFAGSSMLYGYSIWMTIKYVRRENKEDKNIAIILLIGIAFHGVVFGWGTRTAGTALRHRDKAIAVVALASAYARSRVDRSRQYRLSIS